MPYRAERQALEQRAAALEKELAEVRARVRDLLPVLENVRIASPCSASWDDMVGDDKVRFCGNCAKDVFNLSAMTRDEAQLLLASRGSSMCARLYKRADGTVLTADCPVGVKRKRVRRIAAVAIGTGALASAGAVITAGTRPAHTTMGEVTPVATEMGTAVPVIGSVAPPAIEPLPLTGRGAVPQKAVPQKPQKTEPTPEHKK
jgi:hypothetical protein